MRAGTFAREFHLASAALQAAAVSTHVLFVPAALNGRMRTLARSSNGSGRWLGAGLGTGIATCTRAKRALTTCLRLRPGCVELQKLLESHPTLIDGASSLAPPSYEHTQANVHKFLTVLAPYSVPSFSTQAHLRSLMTFSSPASMRA